MSRPVIDVLVTSDARRGAEVFGRRLADGLGERGWDAELVSLTGSDRPGVETVALSRGPVGGLAVPVLASLRRRLTERRPDVVFANGGATLRYSAPAVRSVAGRPRLVYGSIGEPAYWLRNTRHRAVQRLLIAACDHVTAVSAVTKTGLVDDVGVDSAKITVVHPGVDESWFALERARDPGSGPLRALYAGSLSTEKDPLLAVAAVSALGDKVHLRMAGEGPLRSRIEDEAGDNIELLGSVSDLGEQFRWAEVLILPSRTEGLPGVAVEAAAAGLAVVATRVGGTGEVVVDGETGHLVPAGDVDALKKALTALVEDRSMAGHMGAAGRKRAEEMFRLAASVDAYDTVFTRLAAS